MSAFVHLHISQTLILRALAESAKDAKSKQGSRAESPIAISDDDDEEVQRIIEMSKDDARASKRVRRDCTPEEERRMLAESVALLPVYLRLTGQGDEGFHGRARKSRGPGQRLVGRRIPGKGKRGFQGVSRVFQGGRAKTTRGKDGRKQPQSRY
jgi:hypothetical protein